MSDNEEKKSRLKAGKAFPLSLAQREVWFEHILYPSSAVHTVAAQSTIVGPLDVELFERAIRYVCERHQALRLTPVVTTDFGEPLQIEAELPPRLLRLHDVRSANEPRESAEELSKALGRRAIPLDGGVTFRFDLIRFGEESHIWVMTYHHFNMDAWSNGILMRDVSAAYSALAAGKPLEAEAAPNYLEAVYRDREFVNSERYSRNAEYWNSLHSSPPDPLIGSGTLVMRGMEPSKTNLVRFRVNAATVAKLRDVVEARKTTLARLFIAAGLILFHRRSGARDISFGMPVLNRSTARDKATFGLFSLTYRIQHFLRARRLQ